MRITGIGPTEVVVSVRNLFVVIISLVFLSTGCAMFKKAEMANPTPEELYDLASADFSNGKYDKAVEKFQKLKEEYPLSTVAILAELGVADSHFYQDNYAEAEVAYNDFMNLHPTNKDVPYAMYQVGMCHYRQVSSVDRDQTETQNARKAFERLLARFPQSRYTLSAEKNIRECKRRLAEHEFYVGLFYFNTERYAAALKRFEDIAVNYPHVGLDYKIDRFTVETRKLLAEQSAKSVDGAAPPPMEYRYGTEQP